METPLIALFGKTDPRVWGPYPPQADRIIIQRESMDTIDIDTLYHTLSHTIDTLSSGKI
jgi:ADP-heptose:LPS heptosyltransferase